MAINLQIKNPIANLNENGEGIQLRSISNQFRLIYLIFTLGIILVMYHIFDSKKTQIRAYESLNDNMMLTQQLSDLHSLIAKFQTNIIKYQYGELSLASEVKRDKIEIINRLEEVKENFYSKKQYTSHLRAIEGAWLKHQEFYFQWRHQSQKVDPTDSISEWLAEDNLHTIMMNMKSQEKNILRLIQQLVINIYRRSEKLDNLDSNHFPNQYWIGIDYLQFVSSISDIDKVSLSFQKTGVYHQQLIHSLNEKILIFHLLSKELLNLIKMGDYFSKDILIDPKFSVVNMLNLKEESRNYNKKVQLSIDVYSKSLKKLLKKNNGFKEVLKQVVSMDLRSSETLDVYEVQKLSRRLLISSKELIDIHRSVGKYYSNLFFLKIDKVIENLYINLYLWMIFGIIFLVVFTVFIELTIKKIKSNIKSCQNYIGSMTNGYFSSKLLDDKASSEFKELFKALNILSSRILEERSRERKILVQHLSVKKSLDQSNHPLIFLDKNLNLLYSNGAAEVFLTVIKSKLSNTSKIEEISSKSKLLEVIDYLVNPGLRNINKDYLYCLEKKKVYEIDVKKQKYEMIFSPIFDDKTNRVGTVIEWFCDNRMHRQGSKDNALINSKISTLVHQYGMSPIDKSREITMKRGIYTLYPFGYIKDHCSTISKIDLAKGFKLGKHPYKLNHMFEIKEHDKKTEFHDRSFDDLNSRAIIQEETKDVKWIISMLELEYSAIDIFKEKISMDTLNNLELFYKTLLSFLESYSDDKINIYNYINSVKTLNDDVDISNNQWIEFNQPNALKDLNNISEEASKIFYQYKKLSHYWKIIRSEKISYLNINSKETDQIQRQEPMENLFDENINKLEKDIVKLSEGIKSLNLNFSKHFSKLEVMMININNIKKLLKKINNDDLLKYIYDEEQDYVLTMSQLNQTFDFVRRIKDLEDLNNSGIKKLQDILDCLDGIDTELNRCGGMDFKKNLIHCHNGNVENHDLVN